MSYNITRSTVREYAGGSVGGILRKGGTHSNGNVANTSSAAVSAGEMRQVDLLVFGYACKVFRDDEKARDIDQGKHLIPWMGDTSLKIDRYDVRGALSDLAPYEPPPGGYGNRLDYLNADEQRAEQLCEEERYFYLYNNEEEHILQQEEDLKRLKQESSGYNQVAFQYEATADGVGVQHGPNREEFSNSPSLDEAEQVFSLPKNFEVPASIQLPETMKQHAIIEKTARFIASQGVQMEILLKAKQSNNVQFEFLSQNSILNPYYKYIVNAIKTGTYPVEEAATSKESNDDAIGLTTPHTSASGVASVSAKPIITVPTIKYKPSANCAYTQLISKIKGLPLPVALDEENANAVGTAAGSSPNISNTATTPTASGGNFTPVLLQYNGNTYVTADAEDSNSNSNLNASTNTNSQDGQQQQPQVELLKNSSALALAQNYSSDSEEEAEEQLPPKPEPVLNFPIPPESLKNIIDKTATYVIKNGRQFEETLRAKNDERFTFLLYENEFYPYYMYKITGDPDAASKEQKQRKAAAVAAALLSKKGLQSEKTISPVCFSIKPKDDPPTAPLQPVLPQEASDDDEEKKSNNDTHVQSARSVPEHVQKAIQQVERQLLARNEQLAAAAGGAVVGTAISVVPAPTSVRSRFDVDYNSANKAHIKSTKAEMERNALFEQQQQNRQKELKKAEEKVKDKLAQIAREKLGGLLSKEKQLQLERKRKAMAFLNQIKGPPPTNSDKEPTGEDGQTKADDEENASDDSEASVHSIPITSYGPEEKTDDEEEQHQIRIPQTHIAAAATVGLLLKPAEVQTKPKPATVTLSDDDDVQLVSESKPTKLSQQRYNVQKRRSRSRTRDSVTTHSPSPALTPHKRHRKRSRHSSASSSCNHSDVDAYDGLSRLRKTQKLNASNHSVIKSKKSSKSRSHKKKSKKRSRSRSHSRSRTPDKRYNRSKVHQSKSRQRSRSRSHRERSSRSYSAESAASAASQHHRRHAKSQRHSKRSSHTPTPKRKEKKRKHEH